MSADIQVGEVGVEEADEHAHEAALGLTLFAEEEHVVASEDGVDDLGDDGVFVAEDAGEEVVAAAEGGDEVVAEFDLDGAGDPTGAAEVGERAGECCRGGGHVEDCSLVEAMGLMGQENAEVIEGAEGRGGGLWEVGMAGV